MPTQFTTSARKISAGIISDKRVNSLADPWAMLGQARILLKMDNLGRIECDPDQLKAMIYPRNKGITAERCEGICRELHDAGLYFLYSVNDESYLQAVKFNEHQRMVGNMVRNSALPPPNVHNFLKWILEVRKDDDFLELDSDLALTRTVALLYTCIEHVTNTLDTRSIRVCPKGSKKNTDRVPRSVGSKDKISKVKALKKSYAHTLASEKGLKPYEIKNDKTGEYSEPYIAKDSQEAWLLCNADHTEWKQKDCTIYERK